MAKDYYSLKIASEKVELIEETLTKLDEIVALVSAFTMDEEKQTLVTGIVENISDIKLIVDSADEMDIIVSDLIKGNYLGNRKIDIDLARNKTTTGSVVSYKQADIVLVNGTKLAIPFLSGAAILELTSHNDIRNYIINHALWQNIQYTEFTVEEATITTPTIIRFRDADGHSSNVERVELHVYSGTAKDIKPVYFWAQTTSALQTIANRVGDIIALGNDMDNIVELAQRIDELNALQAQLTPLLALHTNLAEILLADNNATIASTKASEALAHKTAALQALSDATSQAVIATARALDATNRANEIKGITTQTATGAAGTAAQVSYNSTDGKFSFVVPQGLKGDRGEAFSVNAMGTFAQRAGYDAQPINFSFFAIDMSLIYFKQSATTGNWSTGIPFGKGDKGDTGNTGNGIATIVRISGTGTAGSADTYRITYTSGGTFDFTVWNGTESVISVNGENGAVLLNALDIPNTPSGSIASTTVQGAINELDGEKANDTAVMHKTGDETIAGIKTFTSPPVVDGRPVSTGQRKNYLINGNFDSWQYGTSQTTSAYGSDDRFWNAHAVVSKTHSRIYRTDTEAALFNATYFSRTVVVDAVGADAVCLKRQYVENVTVLAGKTVTLTFWAKADSNKNIAVSFSQLFGTGGSPSTVVQVIGAQLVALTTTWQKKTITVTIPSIVGKTLGTDGVHTSATNISFFFNSGGAWLASSASLGQQSGTFDIAQVKLEDGAVATDGWHPYDGEFGGEVQACQRYYEVGGAKIFISGAQSAKALIVPFKVTKRVPSTLTYSGTNPPTALEANSVNYFQVIRGTVDYEISFAWTASAEL